MHGPDASKVIKRGSEAGSPKGSGGGCVGCKSPNSLLPKTEVLLADGTRKKIADVEVGDRVLATDPKTGETVAKPVTAEIIGKGAKNLVRVTIDLDGKKGGRTASLTATDKHPFWVPELDEWINTRDLHSGQWLRTSSGTHIQITAIKTWTQPATVHNLTVADIHTYYVLAGATPVLVHNSNGCGVARNEKGQFTSGENADAARGRQTHLNYKNSLGAGYDFEVRLPSGLRPDAVDWKNRVVRELNSDAASSQATGRRQLQKYVAELEDMTGQSWTGHLDTYKRFG
ncbi:polymorphic toxin-type HINT domain-containing protein [Streptomyces sp. NPDC059142]|uniref:polymorphic toxin-type HINT domain-containing protein n=1 Tax=Streptomyces sp. NPDC059142 TaxID=3346739 RepID=UPI00368969A6